MSSKVISTVLKNYDMMQHLAFIGYKEALLYEKLGFVSLNEISPYIAYYKKIYSCLFVTRSRLCGCVAIAVWISI